LVFLKTIFLDGRFPGKASQCERNMCQLWAILCGENRKGRGTFWFPVEPLSPSLPLIGHGKDTFLLRQERIRTILFLILHFHLQANRSDFPLFRSRKGRTFLTLPSLLSGYDRRGNCAGLQDPYSLFPQTNPLSPWENRM
jgi:hypothetical protein